MKRFINRLLFAMSYAYETNKWKAFSKEYNLTDPKQNQEILDAVIKDRQAQHNIFLSKEHRTFIHEVVQAYIENTEPNTKKK